MTDEFSQNPATPARILTVCQGNICRSPYAERMLAMYFSPTEVVVSSAGTGAVEGHGIEENAAALLPERALRTPHKARQLTAEIIAEADVIFAMAVEHRKSIVQLGKGNAVSKTFTLREAARLIMAGGPPPKPASAAEAFTMLPQVLGPRRRPGDQPGTDDIEDPFRRGPEAFERMKAETDPALAVILRYAMGRLEMAE